MDDMNGIDIVVIVVMTCCAAYYLWKRFFSSGGCGCGSGCSGCGDGCNDEKKKMEQVYGVKEREIPLTERAKKVEQKREKE